MNLSKKTVFSFSILALTTLLFTFYFYHNKLKNINGGNETVLTLQDKFNIPHFAPWVTVHDNNLYLTAQFNGPPSMISYTSLRDIDFTFDLILNDKYSVKVNRFNFQYFELDPLSRRNEQLLYIISLDRFYNSSYIKFNPDTYVIGNFKITNYIQVSREGLHPDYIIENIDLGKPLVMSPHFNQFH